MKVPTNISCSDNVNLVCHGPASLLFKPIPKPPSSHIGLHVYQCVDVLKYSLGCVSKLACIVRLVNDTAIHT